MKCKKHPASDAVAQCAECGSYVCADCAKKTEGAKERYGTLCTDCYKKLLQSSISYHYNRKRDALKHMIISMVLFGVGLIALIVGAIMAASSGNSNEPGAVFYPIVGILGGYVLMGLYPGIHAWREANEAQDKHDAKYGATYRVDASGKVSREKDWASIIITIALKLLFGPVHSISLWIGFISIRNEATGYMSKFRREIASL